MPDLSICLIGDDLAHGRRDETRLGWAGRLCLDELAEGNDIRLYNLAVAGDTSRDIAGRWRHECAARLTDDVPAGLVFSFGVNDMADEPGSGIRVALPDSVFMAEDMMREAAQWRPTLWLGPTPVQAGLPPRGPGGRFLHHRNERMAALNLAYAATAAEIGVPYLDLFALLADDPRWDGALNGDGVRPNGQGHAILADAVRRWAPWRGWLDGGAVGLAKASAIARCGYRAGKGSTVASF